MLMVVWRHRSRLTTAKALGVELREKALLAILSKAPFWLEISKLKRAVCDAMLGTDVNLLPLKPMVERAAAFANGLVVANVAIRLLSNLNV